VDLVFILYMIIHLICIKCDNIISCSCIDKKFKRHHHLCNNSEGDKIKSYEKMLAQGIIMDWKPSRRLHIQLK